MLLALRNIFRSAWFLVSRPHISERTHVKDEWFIATESLISSSFINVQHTGPTATSLSSTLSTVSTSSSSSFPSSCSCLVATTLYFHAAPTTALYVAFDFADDAPDNAHDGADALNVAACDISHITHSCCTFIWNVIWCHVDIDCFSFSVDFFNKGYLVARLCNDPFQCIFCLLSSEIAISFEWNKFILAGIMHLFSFSWSGFAENTQQKLFLFFIWQCTLVACKIKHRESEE